MYRIELSPGEETAFRSIEELAVAIRRGVVTPRARIYHNATCKWLPIQFHPHYKIAVEMPLTPAALVAGPPITPLSALSPLTLAPPAVPEPPRQVAPPPEEPAPAKRSRKRKQPRRSLRLALAGALLIAGAHLALSGEPAQRAAESSSPKPRTHRRLVTTQPGRIKSEASSSAAAMVSDLPTGSVPTASQILTQSRAITAQVNAATARFGATTRKAGAPEETADAIEPPPSAIEISVPTLAGTESLAPKLVDSSSKKSLKRILRAIDSSPAKENSNLTH